MGNLRTQVTVIHSRAQTTCRFDAEKILIVRIIRRDKEGACLTRSISHLHSMYGTDSLFQGWIDTNMYEYELNTVSIPSASHLMSGLVVMIIDQLWRSDIIYLYNAT